MPIRTIRTARRAAVASVLLAACLVSCSTGEATGTRSSQAADELPPPPERPAEERVTPTSSETPGGPQGPEAVRDAFSGLQATLDDSCTPGNCAYFVGRVHEELEGLDASMKADGQGPEHFADPIRWIADLRTTLGGDTSTENLQAHERELVGVRDRINTWMQDHPHDYR
ncbi:hypothetical protein ACFU9F_19665 [Streptomyces zhihengii]|uniref:hypothetical protein n=1 Tax=Streptomyces zhihengii TaxID=1818004 RepID=UPI003695DF6F